MFFGDPAFLECLSLFKRRVPEAAHLPLDGRMLYHGSERMCLMKAQPFANIVVIPNRWLPRNLVAHAFSRGVPYRAAGSGERVLRKHLIRWEKVRLSFLSCVEEQVSLRSDPIIVIGEGAGAALAILLTDELSAEGYNVMECLISDCPRLGNMPFLKGLESRNFIQCAGKTPWFPGSFRNRALIPR